MLHWPQRVAGAEVRLGDRVPERDSPFTSFARAAFNVGMHCDVAVLRVGEHLANECARLEHAMKLRSVSRTSHKIEGLHDTLASLGLSFVQMCAAFDFDAEVVIEDAVQKYEAQKTPPKEIPQPHAPTADEISGRTSRQFTL